MSSLLNLHKKHSQFHIRKSGFQETITISTPDGVTSLILSGLATKHNNSFDIDGSRINSKNVQATIVEKDLIDATYPYRNQKNEVSLKGHKVSFKDSSDIEKNYIVTENYPDETLGVIVLILADFRI